MGKNRKPRKSMTQRATYIPMMAPTRDRMALTMHLSVEALIRSPSPDTYNSLSTKFCTLSNAGVDSASLRSGSAALTQICERYERIGKVGVSDAEAMVLRDAVGDLDGLLANVPANKLIAAEAVTAVHCEEMGI